MTEKELIEKVNDITKHIPSGMAEKCRKLCRSGCVDLDSEPNNYRLANNMVIAILEDMASDFIANCASTEDKKEIENLKHFI